MNGGSCLTPLQGSVTPAVIPCPLKVVTSQAISDILRTSAAEDCSWAKNAGNTEPSSSLGREENEGQKDRHLASAQSDDAFDNAHREMHDTR
jgi:hypothetical protein